MSKLAIDLTGLFTTGGGLGEGTLDAVAERAAAAVDRTRERWAAGEVGFFDLPDDRDVAREAMDFARDLSADIDTMVVLGIGGSSLGPQAVHSALARPYDALRKRSRGMPRRLLFPDNVDPDSFAGLLAVCDPERTVFNVVTKSGGTAETAAQFQVVYDWLSKALDAERIADHLVVTTDPERGALRRVADAHDIAAFEIPPNVGGRFSVLTPVGLVPAAVAGLDVMGLLDGAAAMRDRVIEGEAARDVRTNPALMLAAALHAHQFDHGRPMVVIMSYSDPLYSCADWFRQLWAESLGKRLDVDGNEVNVGPTPIAARGATDQHSQLQLFVEGPDDKVYIVLGVGDRAAKVPIVDTPISDQPEYSYLVGRSMGELLEAERRGTVASLINRERPTATITLPRVDAEALGALFMLFEAACAFAGPMYGVDPFDQPGVEEAKRLAYGALGRPGYEDAADSLRSVSGPDARYVFE
jgi:glucose-6-phosphate isomerase